MKPIIFYLSAFMAVCLLTIAVCALVAIFFGAWWHVITCVGSAAVGISAAKDSYRLYKL